tara:strand:- start:95 stop:418 length:324 start_codon:yes stop_codon:yes gene_type:complete
VLRLNFALKDLVQRRGISVCAHTVLLFVVFLFFFCLFVVFQFSIFNWSPQGSKAIFAFYLSDSLLVHSGASLSSSAALVARAVIGTDVALRIVLCGASSGMILEIEF